MDHLEQHTLHVGEKKNYVRMCYLVIYKKHVYLIIQMTKYILFHIHLVFH